MDELETMLNNAEATPETAEAAPKASKKRKKKEAKEPKPARDNIARINAMTSISEVRKAHQIAIAKKAKANGKPELQAKYDLEIQCAKDKLTALVESVKSIADLMGLGEEPNKVITYFIKSKEGAYTDWLEKTGYKVSARVLKAVSDDIPETFFTELPIEIHAPLVSRHEKKDYRLRATCKTENFMKAVESGAVANVEGKWKNADGTSLGVEAKATAVEEESAD